MNGFLGETDVTDQHTFTRESLAMYFIHRYSGIDGDHHQKWLVDQVARCLKGTPAVVKLAKWNNGHSEIRVSLGKPSQEYLDWVEEMLERDEDGEPQYDYDEGIAP